MVSLPVVSDEVDIRSRIGAERERLLAQAGLEQEQVRHFKRPKENPFTRSRFFKRKIIVNRVGPNLHLKTDARRVGNELAFVLGGRWLKLQRRV